MTDKKLKRPLYLDYAATTPVDKRVIASMNTCLSLEDCFGNPASSHVYGVGARNQVEAARENVARLLNTTARTLIFTSGATESNNLALKGVANFYQNKGRHIVTCQSEHRAVLDPCQYLEAQGFTVTYLRPNALGLIDINEFEAALRVDTILVSIMQVNNETGVIQDISTLSAITRKHGILFHMDAAQSVGKIPIDLQKLPIDLLSCSAHKVYGPKGIGALYINDNPRVKLMPLLHGGSQERKLRAGTLPTHQIVGMGEAFRIAKTEMDTEIERLQSLRDLLWQGISHLPNIALNGHPTQCVPGIINLHFKDKEKQTLLHALKDLAISNASACNSIVRLSLL